MFPCLVSTNGHGTNVVIGRSECLCSLALSGQMVMGTNVLIGRSLSQCSLALTALMGMEQRCL
jgi:hypothetical protein